MYFVEFFFPFSRSSFFSLTQFAFEFYEHVVKKTIDIVNTKAKWWNEKRPEKIKSYKEREGGAECRTVIYQMFVSNVILKMKVEREQKKTDTIKTGVKNLYEKTTNV